MSLPWLSVIIPVFNGERYLPAALESVAAQGDPGIEVVAVDDGSTDASLSILEAWSGRLPMTILRSPRSGNWVAGTNAGMAAARGDYLGWLHQDDAWHPGRAAVLKELAESAPDAALLAHPVWFIDAHGRRLGMWRCPLAGASASLSPGEVVPRLLVQNTLAPCAPIFPARIARRIGPLDERLWYTADWDYWLRLAAEGRNVLHPDPLASVRLHAASQTAQRARGGDNLRQQYEVVLDRHLRPWEEAHPGERLVPRLARLSAEVNLALAGRDWRGAVRLARLAPAFLALGPAGWRRFLRDSRLIERTASRLRALGVRGLRACPEKGTGTLHRVVARRLCHNIRVPVPFSGQAVTELVPLGSRHLPASRVRALGVRAPEGGSEQNGEGRP